MSASSSGPRPAGPAGIVIAVGVLMASGATGFLAYRLLTPPHSALYPDTTRRLSARPTDAPASATARQTPEELPDIALPALDGTTRRLTQWRGQPLIINFWATWCEPCRREIPLLKTLRRERAPERLEIVGIAIDSGDATRAYATGQGIDYPVLVGQQGGLETANAFGMDTVLPFSVFVDGKGRIFTLKVGELHRDEAELILDRLAEVDSGKVPPANARSQLAADLQKLNARRLAETAR